MPKSPPKANAVVENGKFMSSVKVGPKGQVVIPKEVRDLFGFGPGDTLLILADADRGIVLHRMDYFSRVADEILTKATAAPEASDEREAGLKFVNAVHAVIAEQPEEKE